MRTLPKFGKPRLARPWGRFYVLPARDYRRYHAYLNAYTIFGGGALFLAYRGLPVTTRSGFRSLLRGPGPR